MALRDGAHADDVIASFVAEGGRTARGYRARDGRVVVPFGFAEAYAGYAAELWADGRRRSASPRACSMPSTD